jgi:hypothetical protein
VVRTPRVHVAKLTLALLHAPRFSAGTLTPATSARASRLRREKSAPLRQDAPPSGPPHHLADCLQSYRGARASTGRVGRSCPGRGELVTYTLERRGRIETSPVRARARNRSAALDGSRLFTEKRRDRCSRRRGGRRLVAEPAEQSTSRTVWLECPTPAPTHASSLKGRALVD